MALAGGNNPCQLEQIDCDMEAMAPASPKDSSSFNCRFMVVGVSGFLISLRNCPHSSQMARNSSDLNGSSCVFFMCSVSRLLRIPLSSSGSP